MYSFNNLKASASPRVISGRSLVHQHLNARQKVAIAADTHGVDEVFTVAEATQEIFAFEPAGFVVGPRRQPQSTVCVPDQSDQE